MGECACALPAHTHTLHTSSNSDGAGTPGAPKTRRPAMAPLCERAGAHAHMGSPPRALNVNPRALCAQDACSSGDCPPQHTGMYSLPRSFCQRPVRGEQRFTSAARTAPISFFIAPRKGSDAAHRGRREDYHSRRRAENSAAADGQVIDK